MFGWMFLTLLVILGVTMYFLPWLVAAKTHRKHQAGIALLNIFLGWTLLGWVIAIVWAVSDPRIDEGVKA